MLISKSRFYEICLFLIFVVFMIPSHVAAGNQLISYIKILGLFISLYLFLTNKLYMKKKLLLFWFWIGWSFIASLINRNNAQISFSYIHPIFSTICILEHLFKKSPKHTFNYLMVAFCILNVVQFLSFIEKGSSYGTTSSIVYFMGYRVGYNEFFMFAVFIACVSLSLHYLSSIIYNLLIIIPGIIFIFSCKLSTLLLGTFCFILLYLIHEIFPKNRKWFFMSFLVLLFSIFFVFGASDPKRFSWVLVDLLGEDVTLSGRTYLWRDALSQMHGIHWLIGNGFAHKQTFCINMVWCTNTAHSNYANIIFKFGIIGLFIYCALLYQTLKGIDDLPSSIQSLFFAFYITIILLGIATSFYSSIFQIIILFISQDGYTKKILDFANKKYKRIKIEIA